MALNCEWPASFMQVLGEINSGLKWNMYLGSKKEKIESISVLRLFFISLILLTHFREYLDYDFFAKLFFKNGLAPIFVKVGVSGFFVISGFVLAYLPFHVKRKSFD